MQISLCFRIISFFKKANKLWVSTLRVQPNLCKTLHGKHEEELYRSSLWKNTLLYHSSGKGDPASPEKCALFFFLAVNECALFYVLTSELLEKAEVATLYHCADRVQVGVESHCLPFHWLCIGVVHGVFERCLAIVVFMDWTSRVLCFGCSPVDENID